MKQPKTIADLNINFIFMREYLSYEYFINEFKARNPKLSNYKIVPNNYVFKIKINEKIIPFKIFMMVDNDGLYDLMFQLYTEISTYLFDNGITAVFELKKFIRTSINNFNIDCEIILL